MRTVNTVVLSGAAIEARRRSLLLTVGDLRVRAQISGRTLWMARTGQAVGMRVVRRLAKALRVSSPSLLAEAPATTSGASADGLGMQEVNVGGGVAVAAAGGG